MFSGLRAIAEAFAAERVREIRERLGFGIHGEVYAAESKEGMGLSAIKVHFHGAPYRRERDIYLRLREARISSLLGFNVPLLIDFDDRRRAIQMSVVTRPFVLDFAGAQLDWPHEFSEAIWDEWESEKKEQFGERWRRVKEVLAALEDLGIYQADVSPSNIAFGD